jgi:prepilin-type N-terminal cleavage/methylation domain-containing protein
MEKNRRNGFTLIELMVVISLITLFSSIALASLQTARIKAYDAVVKRSLNNFALEAEFYKMRVGNFAGLCNDAKAEQILRNAVTAGGGDFNNPNPLPDYCVTGFSEQHGIDYWIIAAPLRSGQETFWCLNSLGGEASTDIYMLEEFGGYCLDGI